ncbi:HNH endonuclease signature motif containing protein [Brevibacterium senegalense]|uniref:HNH endonuclease signature motif containing protein n=1 Tax=Brevibacterium senegalense TaxID=1033736 RepID=UPI0002DE51E0|nr:HNH endonuclease signature motif containing protein [Brevibacterium senegalense]
MQRPTRVTTGPDRLPRPALQILTVDEVREAIARVAAGTFGAVTPVESVESVELGRLSEPGLGSATARSEDGPQFTSSGLMEQWVGSNQDAGRLQALEAAQLAAFALARVLSREDGQDELDRFLSTEGLFEESASASDVDADPRISTQAGRLLHAEDLMIVSAHMRKAKRDSAKRRVAHAIVWFLGFHNLLASVAQGRLAFERIARLGYRVDDALLPLSEVRALDRYLDAMRPDLSMDQFEKLTRKQIRSLVPVPEDPEAPRRNRNVRLERCDDDTGILTLTGPVHVLDALFQRTRATARAIRRRELSALGVDDQGTGVSAGQGVSASHGTGPDRWQDRTLDDRTISQLMFDLLAGSRPQTQVRVAGRGAAEGVGAAAGAAGSADAGMLDLRVAGAGRESDSDEVIDVLCPTDGTWLRKQAAVHVTVPASTLLGMNEAPGWTTGDATLSAPACREIASHATSWVRILTDPTTGVVTDDIAQTYEPTAGMRRTVRQKWRCCTAPGCSRPAESCEIDHCCSYSKKDPSKGGLTVVENLHPLCKHHHQLKTMGIIGLRRVSGDEIVWVLPMGVKSTAVPPPIGETDEETPPGRLLDHARSADAGVSHQRAPVGHAHRSGARPTRDPAPADDPPPF